MRNIKIKDKEIEIKPLTRGCIKKMKHYNYLGPVDITIETADAAIDEMLLASLSADDLDYLDDCTLKDTHKIWNACIKENYGDKEEEKNL